MKRRRTHIAIRELAASALADKLPQAQRDDLRARKVSARDILRLFTPDHVILHAWGGADRWWNLDMRLRGQELKAKDAADTSRAAKAVRLSDEHKEFQRRLLKPARKRKRASTWPQRKLQSRNSFERRA